MAPQRKDPRIEERLATPAIYGLLPSRYHYELKITSNGRIYPCFPFTFGAPPDHPT